MQLFGDSPCVVVEFEARKDVDRSFTYDEKEEKVIDGKLVKVKTGNRREVKRHYIQCIGVDPNGDDFFCLLTPVRDYSPDYSRIVRGQQYRFALSRLDVEDSGLLLGYFCGFEPVS